MDVKALPAMLGHVPAATAPDICTRITNPMRSEAAEKIDRRIGKAAPREKETASEAAPQPFVPFIPCNGEIRKAGPSCIPRVSERCREGRCSPVWPDGKKYSRNVYAKTRKECGTLLPGLIQQRKPETRAVRESGGPDAIPDGTSEKKKAIAACLREHPEAASKSAIAKAAGTDRGTARKYCNGIRSETGLQQAQELRRSKQDKSPPEQGSGGDFGKGGQFRSPSQL